MVVGIGKLREDVAFILFLVRVEFGVIYNAVVAVKFIYSNFSSIGAQRSRNVRMGLSRLWKRRYLRATNATEGRKDGYIIDMI